MLTARTNLNSLLPAFGSMHPGVQWAMDELGQTRRTMSALCPISLWQDDKHVYVRAEVPGMTESDIDLQFEDGKLWIRGERTWHEGEVQFEHNECTFGKFERAISVPDVVDPATIEASLDSGVLEITLTKRPEAQSRSIAIKQGSNFSKKIANQKKSD